MLEVAEGWRAAGRAVGEIERGRTAVLSVGTPLRERWILARLRTCELAGFTPGNTAVGNPAALTKVLPPRGRKITVPMLSYMASDARVGRLNTLAEITKPNGEIREALRCGSIRRKWRHPFRLKIGKGRFRSPFCGCLIATLLITDPVEFDWDPGTQRIHRDAVATQRA